MNVLLSIKPEYAKKILEGEKKYEFRKTKFSRKDEIKYVYLYVTSPVQRIVARFEMGGFIEASPEELWRKCESLAGVERKSFFTYFEGCEKGFAIKVEEVERLENKVRPEELSLSPPQSFQYIDLDIVS